MCLVTFSREPLIAEEDIVCYKQFFVYADIDNIMFTPVTHYKVVIPKNVSIMMDDTNKLVKIIDIPIGSIFDNWEILDKPAYAIGAGMIHAYIVSSVIKNQAWYKKFKCIIPRGTEYYTGLNKDICAKKLLIIKQIV